MDKLQPVLQNASDSIHDNKAEARRLYKGYSGTPSKESAKQNNQAYILYFHKDLTPTPPKKNQTLEYKFDQYSNCKQLGIFIVLT